MKETSESLFGSLFFLKQGPPFWGILQAVIWPILASKGSISYSLTSFDRRHCTNIYKDWSGSTLLKFLQNLETFFIFSCARKVNGEKVFHLFFKNKNASGIENSFSVEWVFKCGLLEDEYLG
jgi:hypothetical protein